MRLREILDKLSSIAAENKLTTPLICGGTAREKAMEILIKGKKVKDIADLDVTTGDATVHTLSKLFAQEMSKTYQVSSKQMDDGHSSVFIGNLKVDFSSNFIDPQVESILNKKGIKNPTALQKEMFSRDFTCNALLLSMDLKKIKDPTKMGARDIKARIIKTCLDPHITFSSNPNRIIRVIYLAAKLNFEVSPDIIKWIKDHKEIIRVSSDSYLTKNINKAFSYNAPKTIKLLDETGLWNYIPITDEILPFYNQRNKTATAQLRQNYDYGEGLFMNLDKYKSVADFRKKRRKKRKKDIENILNTRKQALFEADSINSQTDPYHDTEMYMAGGVDPDSDNEIDRMENVSKDGANLVPEKVKEMEDESSAQHTNLSAVPQATDFYPHPYGASGMEGGNSLPLENYTESIMNDTGAVSINPYNDIYQAASERSVRSILRASFFAQMHKKQA